VNSRLLFLVDPLGRRKAVHLDMPRFPETGKLFPICGFDEDRKDLTDGKMDL
jgi:hypothetical protein